MSSIKRSKSNHEVALWAGVSAFFASLLSIGAIDVLQPAQVLGLIGSFFVAGVTAAGVYAKQRLDDAKRERGDPPDAT
jgi:hypothetical protein